MASDKSKEWLIDNRRIRLDAGLLENVRKIVGIANKKFRDSILNADKTYFPYFFNVTPLEKTTVTGLSGFSGSFDMKGGSSTAKPGNKTYNGKKAHDFVYEAIHQRSILRTTPEKKLVAPDGSNYAWMIDLRRIFLDATLLDAVAEIFWERMAHKLPFQIGGMEVAAIPLLSAILVKSVERGAPINGFIVRKERKSYGEGKLYEGILTDDPIIVVDDLLNSGSSLEKVRVILEQEEKRIAEAFVVIDYESAKGLEWREKHNIGIDTPYKLKDFKLEIKKKTPGQYNALFNNVWTFTSPNPNFYHRVPKSFPATDGTHIYFGSDGGHFWCLNAAIGQTVWSFKVMSVGHKNIWSAPALHDGRVYFGSYDGNVYCLDAGTGREIWRFIEADWVGSSPALAPELGMLFIGLEFAVEGKRGSVIALNMETGERVWEHPTKRYTHASPAYWPERKLVACGSNDNEMFLLDAATGRMRWRFETKGEGGEKGSIRHAPAFDTKRNHLITGCADHYIYIIDVETGKEVWSVKTDNTIYTVPLVVGDFAYIGSTDKHFYVLDLENKTVKTKIFMASKIFAPPRFINGKIYVSACNGLVYEIDPATHEITGAHQLPDAITNAIVYSDKTDMYYVLTYVNQLFALKHV